MVKEPQDSHMLHALVEEWGKGGKGGERAWGSQPKPLEPNTRATSLPLRAHTLLHKWTQVTQDVMEATPKSRGQ